MPLAAALAAHIPPADHAWLAAMLSYLGRASLHAAAIDGPEHDLHVLLVNGSERYRVPLALLRQWHARLRSGQPMDWAALAGLACDNS